MVRAGVVSNNSEWAESGYHEIQNTPDRYRTINTPALLSIADFPIENTLLSGNNSYIWGEMGFISMT